MRTTCADELQCESCRVKVDDKDQLDTDQLCHHCANEVREEAIHIAQLYSDYFASVL